MALSDVNVRSAKPEAKAYKLTDGDGMVLLVHPNKAVQATGRFEVASRLQQRTTAIMRYAVQSGLIDYNPVQEMAGAVASSNRVHRPALEL